MAKRGRKPRNQEAAEKRIMIRLTTAEKDYLDTVAAKFSTLSDTAGTADFTRAVVMSAAKALERGQDIFNLWDQPPEAKSKT
jgi:hypothetical protein